MAEKKPREAWEMRFLADWLPRRFPRAQRVMLNVRLGELPREAGGRALTWPERRAMGVKNRFADALVLDGGTLWLIETSLGAKLEKAAQLEVYDSLLPETEELAELAGLPVRKLLVVAQEDRKLREWCRPRGIEVAFHRPPFIEAYLAATLRKDLGPLTLRARG